MNLPSDFMQFLHYKLIEKNGLLYIILVVVNVLIYFYKRELCESRKYAKLKLKELSRIQDRTRRRELRIQRQYLLKEKKGLVWIAGLIIIFYVAMIMVYIVQDELYERHLDDEWYRHKEMLKLRRAARKKKQKRRMRNLRHADYIYGAYNEN